MEVLNGGREGVILRQGNHVTRPASASTVTVHQLLRHLHQHGFHACPEPLDLEQDRETVSFVLGDCYNYSLSGKITSINALKSAARLLRNLHDASQSFLSLHSHENLHWMLPARAPMEVICHGDFMPYNVVLDEEVVVGVFDFDTAHPAPRIWDIAFAVYGWAPFKTDETDKLGSLEEQISRARIFCDAYDCSRLQREELVETMTLRLTALVDYMRTQASEGNEQFAENIAQGHHLAYLNDIDYLNKYRHAITQGLLQGLTR
ncbi:phosphotransferase enzyme family protein [Vibrio vulnificus]|uniref:phosphotransferase enzyme family protein n=1 Tax=Vibrio vulnificus TaxID=672 RepID=UPI003F66538C